MKYIMEIVKSLEDSVSETIQNEAKEQKVRFLTILLAHWVQVY